MRTNMIRKLREVVRLFRPRKVGNNHEYITSFEHFPSETKNRPLDLREVVEAV